MKTRIARASLSLVISAALVLAGCSTSWIKTALADLPVITQVALNIASIVAAAQGKGQAGAAVTTQVQAVANQVQSDLTLVQNLIDTYQNAPLPAAPAFSRKSAPRSPTRRPISNPSSLPSTWTTLRCKPPSSPRSASPSPPSSPSSRSCLRQRAQ
jgi:hypothetical protein